jgi:hypothetical protein
MINKFDEYNRLNEGGFNAYVSSNRIQEILRKYNK